MISCMNSTADILALVTAMADGLRRYEGTINDLNVFPVPDGDTGTNMLMTLEAGVAGSRAVDDGPRATLEAFAHNCLLGARGNSGVIFSQMVRGFVDSYVESADSGTPALATHLTAAYERAYRMVEKPAEGTMLTVMRDIASEARGAADGVGTAEVMAGLTRAARRSVAGTTDQLDVLKKAGVVDAGGYGLEVMVTAAARCLGAEVTWARAREGAKNTVSVVATELTYRFCTEFAVLGAAAEAAETIRGQLSAMGDCVLVVGDSEALKVHVHCNEPEVAMASAALWGELAQERVSDMVAETRERSDRLETSEGIGVVAVSAGDGIGRLFAGLGVGALVDEAEKANPSTAMLLAAIDEIPQAEVIVLPNNKNVVAAAQEAAGLSTKTVVVVPTISFTEGIAALMALDEEASLMDNQTIMAAAAAGSAWGAVAKAARTTADVREGDYFAVDRQGLLMSGGDLPATGLLLAGKLAHGQEVMITLIIGRDADGDDIPSLTDALRGRFPGATVEVVHGGQPIYELFMMVE